MAVKLNNKEKELERIRRTARETEEHYEKQLVIMKD
jgi:hypothetical protein